MRLDEKSFYGYSLHPEPDAHPALMRLIGHLSRSRYEDEFTSDEFRAFRDGLSTIGIDLREIENWTESRRQCVL